MYEVTCRPVISGMMCAVREHERNHYKTVDGIYYTALMNEGKK